MTEANKEAGPGRELAHGCRQECLKNADFYRKAGKHDVAEIHEWYAARFDCLGEIVIGLETELTEARDELKEAKRLIRVLMNDKANIMEADYQAIKQIVEGE